MRSAEEGIGCIAFTPLAQGLLTDKYLTGVPQEARISRTGGTRSRPPISALRTWPGCGA